MFRKIIFILFITTTFALAYEEGIRIAWDYNTVQKLYGDYSFYPRMIRLKNGDILCTFENWSINNNQVNVSILVIRSSDDGVTWSEPATVAQTENGINPAVPDLIQLNNGSIFLAYNPRPPQNNVDPNKRFSIKTSMSMDNGFHWMYWSNVYTASYFFGDGCWEPAPLQLPSGELQLYIANEFPYSYSGEQEITMFRSTNYGYSWTDTVTVSFRKGHRDGMPVPLLLKNGKGIAVAIEDNGWGDDQFKPTIIWTSLEDNWHSGCVTGDSPLRWRALKPAFCVPDGEIGAAPYIVQFPSGEVILSYQGTEGQHPNSNPDANHVAMFTAIGNFDGKNFSRKSKPFLVAPERSAMWNSLFVKNDKTVTAVSSTNNFSPDGKSEIYSIDGYVQNEPQIPFANLIKVDGMLNEDVWLNADSLFIGAYSKTRLIIKMAWNTDALFVGVKAVDTNLWADDDQNSLDDDGISVYFDLNNQNSFAPQKGIFKISADISGEVGLQEGTNDGGWSIGDATGILTSAKISGTLNDTYPDSGYILEMKIPWQKIGNLPIAGTKWGIHLEFNDDVDGNAIDLVEGLSGDESQKPFTWLATQLKDSTTALPSIKKGQGMVPFKLRQNYPNPFNSSTKIDFTIYQPEYVSLDIFNLAGEKVQNLFSSYLSSGQYEKYWNGCNAFKEPVPTGVYFYRLSAGARKKIKKMILIR